MGTRLFSNNDVKAAAQVKGFAGTIAREPQRYGILAEDAGALLAAAERFAATLRKARFAGSRSTIATREKNEARAEAKRLMERAARSIRVNENVTPIMLHELGMQPAAQRRRRHAVPQESPRLRFVRALHEGGAASPVHELEFGVPGGHRNRKAEGAVRLELYMALVPPDGEVPERISSVYGEHPLHLGGFTRSPSRVEPRIANVPMLIVYWGRWVGSNNDLGPWSATCIARIEGWPQHVSRLMMGSRRPAPLMDASAALDAARGASSYSVIVRDIESDHRNRAPALPERADAPQHQLPGPAESEAA
jgi:hypothetical protein